MDAAPPEPLVPRVAALAATVDKALESLWGAS
jgi:hypothetical protein